MQLEQTIHRKTRKTFLTLLLAVLFCSTSHAATNLSITGRITDTTGKPIAHAVVIVYHAGPKSGYGIFCPTCYPDCGKRAITDGTGSFAIQHLNSNLWFELFVEKGGYEPVFLKKVIPAPTTRVTATLLHEQRVTDPTRLFRGRVVDAHGAPLADAVVKPIGALLPGNRALYTFNVMAQGVDPIAITDNQGDFQIAYHQPSRNSVSSIAPSIPEPPLKILASVEARGMADEFSVLPAGSQWHTITATDGAIVRGRLVQNGKPVGGAEIALSGNPLGGWDGDLQSVGNPYTEITIGTQPDGTFVIPNVPVPWNWYIYARVESVAPRGATGDIRCATKLNGQIVDVGDLQLKPAYHFRGTVVLGNGKPVPTGTIVTISSDLVRDSQTAVLSPTGHFEFAGLAAGLYDISVSVKGYSPPPVAPVSIKDRQGRIHTYTPPPSPVSVSHNVDNFVITLHPR